MQNHNNDTIKASDTVLRKIYLSLYLKGLCVRGSWRPNRTATYWPPLLWPQQRFSPVLLGCSIGGLGPSFSGCWFSLPQLISNWSDLQLTDFLSSPGLYNNLTPTLLPASVIISHSFNQSTVKVLISWYSSTGCTCYLHRWISYFDSPAGSEVNMQKSGAKQLKK